MHRPRILFLDEPTAGVDVRSRGLFWERIQEEAQSGATVFVTTHFMEEADYCDWVCFIHAGRLIADAPPEELRRRFTAGYRIDVAMPADERSRAVAELGRPAEPTPDGFRLTVDTLDPALLSALQHLAAARVRIDQPPMTEVFRRVLAGSGSAP